MLMNAVIFAFPLVTSSPSWKWMNAGKLLQADPSQGFSGFGSTFYFTAYSRVGTGDINDFAVVKLGSHGDVIPRFGFCSDTLACTMTLTGLTDHSVTYTASAAGGQRLWTPDMGEPDTITGGTMSWDAVNSVVDVNTGGASTVVVGWTTPGVVASTGLLSGVNIIANLFPFIVIMLLFGATKSPDQAGVLIKLAIIAGIIAFLAAFII
jgi:hypothetical protein